MVVAPGPVSLTVANVNGGSVQDIIVGSHLLPGAITVLLGNGNGTFSSSQINPVAAPTTSVRVGDFDGDGRPDIAAAHPGLNSVSLLKGAGDGTFTPFAGSPISTGLYGYTIDVGDLNGDGKLDLVAGNLLPSGGIAVMLGNGTGGLNAIPGSPIFPGPQPGFVAITDLDSDGKLDIASANGGSGNLSLFRNTCTPLVPPTLGNYPNVTVRAGQFVRSIPTAPPTNKTSITMTASPGFGGTMSVNPVNGRARIWNAGPAGTYTITVTAYGYGSVSKTFQVTVIDPLSCGNIAFDTTTRPLGPDQFNPFTLAVGDFDGDGFSDIAGADNGSDSVSIQLADQDYPQPAPVPVTGTPRSIVAGDFNGDGIHDLVTGNRSTSTLSLLLGNGDDEITFTESVIPVPAGAFELAKGDFNRDGRDDIAVTSFDAGKVSILLGTNTGFALQPASPFSVGAGAFKLAVGDFNRDGKADIAVANNGAANVAVVFGHGDGTFGPPTLLTTDPGPRGIAVADLDGDGYQDIATANVASNTVNIFFGDGYGSFTPSVPYAVGAFPQSVTVGDLDGDGAQDLIVTNANANNVTVLRGIGGRAFASAPGSPFAVGSFPRDAVTLDQDSDGRLDLAVVNYNSHDISYLRNVCTQGNTQIGSNVFVQTVNADFTFSNVTSGGNTTVTPIPAENVGDTPGGFAVSDIAFEVTTTATFTGSVKTCFEVPGIGSAEEFGNLRVLHLEDGSLVDRTTSWDYPTQTICATTTSFSPFYLTTIGKKVRSLFDRSKAFKAGSTVPVKVQILNGSDQNLSAATVPLNVRGLRRIGSTTAAIVTDAGNSNPDYFFRYDSNLGGYIYNLKTTGLMPGKYVLSFYAGSDHSFFYTVTFDLK